MFEPFSPLPPSAEKDLAGWFDSLARGLAESQQWGRLFDLRLLQTRSRLGLPLDRRGSLDDVDEPRRGALEEGYLAACREVGALLLESGRFRDAWMYLRPAGERLRMREHLRRAAPAEQHLDELIDVALLEGVDPERGLAWLLGRQGTCNAITTLDALQGQLDPHDLRACAEALVRHVAAELRGNLRGHLHRLRGSAPPDLAVRELVEQHPELLADGSYHLDPSHLASAVRYGRLLHDRSLLSTAWELADYGRRLPADLQYPGDPPFEETFPAHCRFFDVLLERDVEAGLAYFGARAEAAAAEEAPFGPLETWLILLCRSGRPREALDAYARWLPRDRELSSAAPTLLELARQGAAWERHAEICRARGDVVGFAAGELARREDGPS